MADRFRPRDIAKGVDSITRVESTPQGESQPLGTVLP